MLLRLIEHSIDMAHTPVGAGRRGAFVDFPAKAKTYCSLCVAMWLQVSLTMN